MTTFLARFEAYFKKMSGEEQYCVFQRLAELRKPDSFEPKQYDSDLKEKTTAMTLSCTSKIYGTNHRAKTLYLSIASRMAQDSQFPFKAGNTVRFKLLPDGTLIVKKSRRRQK